MHFLCSQEKGVLVDINCCFPSATVLFSKDLSKWTEYFFFFLIVEENQIMDEQQVTFFKCEINLIRKVRSEKAGSTNGRAKVAGSWNRWTMTQDVWISEQNFDQIS